MRATRRTAFTFVELVMGMTVTAMVGVALAAFSMSLSRSWTDSQESQSAHLLAGQASLRIMPILQDAKMTGFVRAGSLGESSDQSATLMFWKSDANADGEMQLPEIALLEHDRLDDRIELYEVQYPATFTSGQRAWIASLPVTEVDLNDSDAPETFKYVVRQIKSDYAPRPLVGHTGGALFEVRNADSDTQRPTFVYTLLIRQGNTTATEYGSATLRGAVSLED